MKKYLLDTNVVCEATARQPVNHVLQWIEDHTDRCYLSSVTLGEIWKGLHRLPEGKRKRMLCQWAEELEHDFADRTLALDTSILKVWGKLYAQHEATVYNLDVMDSLLAATALHHGLIVITRNTGDFPHDVKTKNPWLD